ncbi:MAG: hypothetical protein Q8R76_07310 [Candidatus Omnitrophota bacterium]|nr:hypothetical protein [Candidatus Omnitrophota bacterium]
MEEQDKIRKMFGIKPELAGVIACLQEIELICGALEDRSDLEGAGTAAEMKRNVQRCLADNSGAHARQLMSFLKGHHARYRDIPAAKNLFKAEVKIDGTMTTLDALLVEFAEVIEDLPPSA